MGLGQAQGDSRRESAHWRRTSSDHALVRAGLEEALLALAKGQTPTLDFDVSEWVNYLLWLRSCLDAKLFEPSQLLADELEGVRLHDEVLRGLQGRLRRCGSCGRLTEGELACEHCRRPIQGSKA